MRGSEGRIKRRPIPARYVRVTSRGRVLRVRAGATMTAGTNTLPSGTASSAACRRGAARCSLMCTLPQATAFEKALTECAQGEIS